MRKKVRLTENELVNLIKRVVREQQTKEYNQDYTKVLNTKKYPRTAFDFIESLESKGFTINPDPITNNPTQAVKGKIKISLREMRCDDPHKFGIFIDTPEAKYEGCVGLNEMVVMTTSPGKAPKGYKGTLSSDFGFESGSSKTKVLNKDIGTVLDKIINFAESGRVFN
jgi:hypothetical protein